MSVSRKKDQFTLNDGSTVHYEIEEQNNIVLSTTLYVQNDYAFSDKGDGAVDAFESLLCSLLFAKVYLKRKNVLEGINAAWDGIIDRYRLR